jgi:hypothetical protein
MRTNIPRFTIFAAAFAISGVGFAAAAPAPVPLDRFRPCLAIDDMTKERLDCFDTLVAPEPKPAPPKARSIMDCRFLKEEDARLLCYNSFLATRIRQGPRTKKQQPAARPVSPTSPAIR